MGKDGCVHRYDEVTGTAKLSSSTPGQYLQLGRTRRPKSKTRSDLDFGGKNRKKVDWRNRPRAGFSEFSTRNRNCVPESILHQKSTPFCGSFALLSSSELHLWSDLCTLEKIKGTIPPLAELTQYLPSFSSVDHKT